MLRRISMLAVLVIGVSQISGCIYSREISQTRRQLEHEMHGASFDRRVTINLGPAAIRFARFVTRRVPEEDAQMVAGYLDSIRRVKVGIYKTRRMPDLEEASPPTLDRFARDGWELAARIQEDDEMIWVYYRDDEDLVTDIYAIVLTEEELVMAHVKGRLNQLLEDAVADHGPFLDLADG